MLTLPKGRQTPRKGGSMAVAHEPGFGAARDLFALYCKAKGLSARPGFWISSPTDGSKSTIQISPL